MQPSGGDDVIRVAVEVQQPSDSDQISDERRTAVLALLITVTRGREPKRGWASGKH